MTVLPVVAVIRPTDLIGVDNGALDPHLLTPIGPQGLLHHTAARAWAALVAAAGTAGIPLTYTYGGTYRSLGDQMALFRSRYTRTELPGRPTKVWLGQTWWQLPQTAMAAVPGTSNHGLGLAVDTATDSDWSDGLGPDDAASIVPHLGWLSANAALFGWSWEGSPPNIEPWHLHYMAGDLVPAAVLAYEQSLNPQPPSEEDDMAAKALIISVHGDTSRGPALWYPETGRMYGLGATDAPVITPPLDASPAEVTTALYDDARTKALVVHGYGHIVNNVYEKYLA